MEKKEKIVQRTFSKLDVDNSGYIDADELVSWMNLVPTLAVLCHATMLAEHHRWLAVRTAQYKRNAAEHRAD